MNTASELNLFSRKAARAAPLKSERRDATSPARAAAVKSERRDDTSPVKYVNLMKMKAVAAGPKPKEHKPLKVRKVTKKTKAGKQKSGSRQGTTTGTIGFACTCDSQQLLEDAWSWNSHFVKMINYHALSHPTHTCSQVIQGYFEFAGGGAAEQACEALNAVGIMQVNVKAQSDWDKNKMTALQNQTFVKHVGEDVPCRFGDITDLVATESKSMLADKQVTVSLSQTELLAALQIRKCYIKEDDHTSDSTYKSDNDTDTTEECESDSDTTVESDGKDMVNVSYQDAAPQENSPNTSDISISESDISVASDENDVEVLSVSTLRTRIDNLFKKGNTLKAKLGHAEASWKLIAVSGSAPSVFF